MTLSFLQLTSLLSELGLNIQEAHAFSTADGFSLDVFVVDGWPHDVRLIIVFVFEMEIKFFLDLETFVY